MKKLFLILPFVLFSCKNENYKKEGKIDIISNVYFHASKNLTDYRSFVVSRLNFKNDTIIEFVPSLTNEFEDDFQNIIIDTTYYPLPDNPTQSINDVVKTTKGYSVFKKKSGALFAKDKITNLGWKKELSDTILFNTKLSRFDINSPESFSRYYIRKSDTLLPYSLYQNETNAGRVKGQIVRIDSYNKKKDIFVTLQLMVSDKTDPQAKTIFDFNSFSRKKKAKQPN